MHNAYAYKRNVTPGAFTAEAEFANDDFEVEPLDKKTAAIVARQKAERVKAKADKAIGLRPRKPRPMDKSETRRTQARRCNGDTVPEQVQWVREFPTLNWRNCSAGTVVRAPAERRHPFKEYTYEELINAPKKVYLCGDDDRPVLLTDALWQTMGLLKSGKTFFCMELGFCIAFGLEFHGLPTKEGNVAYIIAEGGIGRNYQRVMALCAKYEDRAPDEVWYSRGRLRRSCYELRASST